MYAIMTTHYEISNKINIDERGKEEKEAVLID